MGSRAGRRCDCAATGLKRRNGFPQFPQSGRIWYLERRRSPACSAAATIAPGGSAPCIGGTSQSGTTLAKDLRGAGAIEREAPASRTSRLCQSDRDSERLSEPEPARRCKCKLSSYVLPDIPDRLCSICSSAPTPRLSRWARSRTCRRILLSIHLACAVRAHATANSGAP